MGFTVSHADGVTNDADFKDYTRLLRGQGIDLGKVPRAPEPGTGRRWLYVWDTKPQAQKFANALKRETNSSWVVREVVTPPSEGPLGPIIVQTGWAADEVVFQTHPSGRAIIRSAFPNARLAATTIGIRFDTPPGGSPPRVSVPALAREMLPTLTGLDAQELARLGYVLIEDDADRTLAFVPPGDIAEVEPGVARAG